MLAPALAVGHLDLLMFAAETLRSRPGFTRWRSRWKICEPRRIASCRPRSLPRSQHGKRADAIVKSMLLHSREGSGEHRDRLSGNFG